MRFIDKRTVCKALQRRRYNKPQTDSDAKKAWRRFNKKAIRHACYKQQLGLCAYTELSLDDEQLGCHLEHIAPRSRYPERTFEMNNIILAAMDEHYSGQLNETERFGGHFKKALYDDEWFISPFDSRCEYFFQYCEKTGHVFANQEISDVDQKSTKRTIDTLNLNCDYLIEMRRQHLHELREAIQSLTRLNESSLLEQQKDFESLKKATLEPVEKKLPVFFSAKKQLLDRIEREYYQKTFHR